MLRVPNDFLEHLLAAGKLHLELRGRLRHQVYRKDRVLKHKSYGVNWLCFVIERV